MRRRLRRLVQGLMHNPLDHLGAQRRLASRSRRIAAQSGDAFGKVALLPAPHRHLTFADQRAVGLAFPAATSMSGRSSSCRSRQPTATRSVPAKPASAACSAQKPTLPRRPLRGRQPDACQCLRHSPRIAAQALWETFVRIGTLVDFAIDHEQASPCSFCRFVPANCCARACGCWQRPSCRREKLIEDRR